jgi:hypothetical protein
MTPESFPWRDRLGYNEDRNMNEVSRVHPKGEDIC